MKRSTKQLLSMLLAIVMVVGLMAPAMAATPIMGESAAVAETPVEDTPAAELSGNYRPAVSAAKDEQAELSAPIEGANTKQPEEAGTFVLDPKKNEYGIFDSLTAEESYTDKYWANDYFHAVGSSPIKTKYSSGPNGIELPKQEGGYVEFTACGTATVTAVFGNGSGNKASAMALKAADGTYAPIKSVVKAPNGTPAETPVAVDARNIVNGNIALQAGGYGFAVLVTWEVEAGTYQLVAAVVPEDKILAQIGEDETSDGGVPYVKGDTNGGDPNEKGARFYNLTVVQEGGAAGGTTTTNTYTFDATTIPNSAADAEGADTSKTNGDKAFTTAADIATGTTPTGSEFVTMFKTNKTIGEGDAAAEVKGTIRNRSGTTNLKGIELEKAGTAGLDFSVQGTGVLKLTLASTGKSNGSSMALVKVTDESIVTPTEVTGGQGQDNSNNPIEGTTSAIADGNTAYKDKATDTEAKYTPAAGAVVVYGNNSNATTVTYNALPAGDYRIATVEGANRGVWVIKAELVDTVTAKPVTDNFAFDATTIPNSAADAEGADTSKTNGDKAFTTVADIATGTTPAGSEFVTMFKTNKTIGEGADAAEVKGTIRNRSGSANLKGIELEKAGTAGLDFSVQGTGVLKLTLASTGKSNGSSMALVKVTDESIVTPTEVTGGQGQDNSNNPIEGTTSAIADGNTAYKDKATDTEAKYTPAAGAVVVYGNNSNATTVTYNALPAGDYRIATVEGANRGVWVIKVELSDTYMAGVGTTTRVKAPWTVEGVGASTIAVTSATDGELALSVTGTKVGRITTTNGADKTITTYADAVVATLYDATGAEVATEKVIDNAVSFTPAATGNYTVKVFAQREGESDLEVGATASPIAFTLPLAVPVINSAASNGLEAGKETASVTVSWSAVPEATGYKLYVKENTATEWGEAISVSASTAANVSYTVTGLTVGTKYDFAAESLRNTETSAKSEVESVVVTGTKQIPWTTKVFGTSATDQDGVNSVITGDYKVDFTIEDDSGKPIPGTEHKEEILGLTGDLNTDPGDENSGGTPRVLLSSKDGAGKITEPAASDGLLFHYTTVPAGYNYSLKAKVHVTRWFTRDTQNGLGLAALDRVPAESWHGASGSNGGDFWNNSYMVGAARLGFSYDEETGKVYYSQSKYGDKGHDAYTKYSYYMGLCSITKHGTPAGYDVAGTVAPTFMTRRFPLDTRLCKDGVTAKYNGQNNRFNTIGNYEKVPAGWSAQTDTSGKTMHKYEMTDFILELKKTPTGYVSTAWTLDGEKLGENIEYYAKGAAELSGTDDDNPYTHTVAVKPENAVDQSGNKDKGITNMDPSAEYVGFFTSRDTDALFSNVEFDMWPQSEDEEAAQTPPITTVTPTLSIASGTSSNAEKFTLSIATNVDGWVTISQNGSVIATDEPIQGDVRLDKEVTLKPGANTFKVSFKLDETQADPTVNPDWPPYTVLDTSTKVPDKTSTVTYEQFYSTLTNIYVSPNANSTGRGTRNSPMDIYTAVSVVAPGQNIILLGGEYKLFKSVRIDRSMDGTPEKPIYFMAEPGEKVVLNGMSRAGTVLVHGADWWVFKDFEVVGSSSGATGFQLSGSNNIVQNVDAHDNGSTGFTVGRLSGSDKIPVRPTPETPADQVTDWGEWPCNNTIINCESYRNYDSGYNGADGFGAKQTVGSGNVFDGCVAYWNADDGWDLFAKSEPDMGCLGVITLKNCITFQNGYEVRKVINPSTQECEMEADGYTPKMNLDENGKIILAPAGNGNGFKMGGNHLPGAHVIENSYAFYNKAKGFDSNNGPDIKVRNCTGYNNGDENVGLSSNSTPDYEVTNVISFKDDDAPVGQEGKKGLADGIKEGGTTKVTNFYKWDGKKSSNGTKDITAANFASRDFDNTKWINGAPRKDDGSLDLGDFLKLVEVTDAGAGELTNDATLVETPDAVTNPPEEDLPTGGVGVGGGGGSAAAPKPGETPDDGDKPVTPEKTYTADKRTDINGNTEIVVKDNNGEVVADVKIPATIPAPETKFDDVPEDHWAEESINNMAALGIVNGVGDNKYDMDSAVTRGTIATMLYRFASGKAGKTNPFTDVAGGQWYTDAIAWAADSGVVTGYDATTFGPNDTITREQLAVMLYRFAKLIGMDGTVSNSALADYNDVASVDDWAEDGMAWCVSKGIINGVSADTLSPTTSATRAQTATMLDRFIGLMK